MSVQTASSSPVPLESVISTEELNRRPARQPDLEAINAALVALAKMMARSPERILQELVETALTLCRAHSAGISLLEQEDGQKIFRWHGVAGQFAAHLWGTTPREFSPCGTVLDTNAVQLMTYPDRHFSYFAEVEPRITEALLVPFHVGGEAVGTVWVVSHDQTRKFDSEDARMMTTLGEFAAAAYEVLSGTVALKSIIATTRAPLLVLDGKCRIKSASRSFYEAFQLTPEVTEGRLLYQLGNGEWDIPALRAGLEEVLPKEGMFENFEVTLDFASLGRRVLCLNARKLWREDNPTGLILLTMEDITNRKRNEEELLRSHEDLQRFAYAAAHDLRAPLNSSMRLLDLFDRRTGTRLEEGDRHLLSLAKANLERLQALMSDMLTWSQVGGTENTAIVSLKEALETALANLQEPIEQTAAQVNFDLLPEVGANRSQLTLVFQNLIGNALKFRSDEPPRLHIGATLENREWVVSIADNGQGFDSQFAEQIFQPFKRLHGPEIPGSGIGLASCKHAIERLGGRIWAESAPGQGAKFYFTLPQADA
ncbi:MAG: ATP-binding protein, partial [Acidobacteriota bacterium]|nr:ATP-binding protein [Acidobacteriota bacterium]